MASSHSPASFCCSRTIVPLEHGGSTPTVLSALTAPSTPTASPSTPPAAAAFTEVADERCHSSLALSAPCPAAAANDSHCDSAATRSELSTKSLSAATTPALPSSAASTQPLCVSPTFLSEQLPGEEQLDWQVLIEGTLLKHSLPLTWQAGTALPLLHWQRRHCVLTWSDRLRLGCLLYYTRSTDEWCLKQLILHPAAVTLSQPDSRHSWTVRISPPPVGTVPTPTRSSSSTPEVGEQLFAFRAATSLEADEWLQQWQVVTGSKAQMEPAVMSNTDALNTTQAVAGDGSQAPHTATGVAEVRLTVHHAAAASAYGVDTTRAGDDLAELERAGSERYVAVVHSSQPTSGERAALGHLAATMNDHKLSQLINTPASANTDANHSTTHTTASLSKEKSSPSKSTVPTSTARGNLSPSTDTANPTDQAMASSAERRPVKRQWMNVSLLLGLSFHHWWWAIVLAVNIGFWHLGHSHSFLSDQSTSVLALVQFLACILVRNEHFIIAVYTVSQAGISALSWLARVLHIGQRPGRRMRLVQLNVRYVYWSLVHYLGGAHVAFGVAAFAWTIYYWKNELNPFLARTNALCVTIFAIWAVLSATILSALPPVRYFCHNYFETIHRLLGWSLLGLLAVHVSLTYNQRAATLRAVDVFNSVSFWVVLVLLCLAILPWARQQYVLVTIDVPLIEQTAEEIAEAAKKSSVRRQLVSYAGHPALVPGIGMMMTVPDSQVGWPGEAAAGTATRYSLNCWEFHSFIAVASNPGLREVQGRYEQHMHEQAKLRVREAEESLACRQRLLEKGLVHAEAELVAARSALSLTQSGEQFTSATMHNFHNLIAAAGDWTGGLLNEAVRGGVLLRDMYGYRVRYQRKLFARRYKAPGYGWTVESLNCAVVVCTGGGAAGALPYMYRYLDVERLREERLAEQAASSTAAHSASQPMKATEQLLAGQVQALQQYLNDGSGRSAAATSALHLSMRAGRTGEVQWAGSQNDADVTSVRGRHRTWAHLFWVCRSPALNYRELYDAVVSLPPAHYTIIDTSLIQSSVVARYLPSLAVSAYYHYHAEAITVVSGPAISEAVCDEARKHWIPAYRPTFDS